MKKRECEKLARQLQAELPGFAVRDWMMFMAPIKHVLRAIVFDTSDNADWFYVHVMIQPLFVPIEHMALSLGWRIGQGKYIWDRTWPDLVNRLQAALNQEHAIQFLGKINSPADVVHAARKVGVRSPGEGIPYIQEAVAYGFAYEGDIHNANRWIESLLMGLDMSMAWQRETADRAKLIQSKLFTDPEDVRRQLEAWEGETVKNLGLEQYRTTQ